MKKRPVIGITSSLVREVELRNYYKTSICIDYSKSIVEAGGIPVVLPTLTSREDIKAQLDILDGIILAGGGDLSPRYYGEDYFKGIGETSVERDENEWIIMEEFIKTNKPILGICRGMQLINIFLGGDLYQDDRYIEGNLLSHKQETLPDLGTHRVRFEKECILSEVLGKETYTNSFHHQFVRSVGKGLKVTGRAIDGIVESIEGENHKFLVGVQWHPEMMAARGNEDMQKIFNLLVERSRK